MAQFKINEFNEVHSWVTAGERLWLAEDNETVVREGDPRASFFFRGEGDEITRDDALKYGLVKPTKDEKQAEKAEEAAEEATASQILDDVGDDAAKAQTALDAENASEKPRKTLVAKLEKLAQAEE